jgi:hypothetical protein
MKDGGNVSASQIFVQQHQEVKQQNKQTMVLAIKW